MYSTSTTLSVSGSTVVQAPQKSSSSQPPPPSYVNKKSEPEPEPEREPERAAGKKSSSTSYTYTFTGAGNSDSTDTQDTVLLTNPASFPPTHIPNTTAASVTAPSTSLPIEPTAITDATQISPTSTQNTHCHSHRQTNNSSKLPAFRFADLKGDSLALPSLSRKINSNNNDNDENNNYNPSSISNTNTANTNKVNHIPSLPVSPDPDQIRVSVEQSLEELSPVKFPTSTLTSTSQASPIPTATTSSEYAHVKRSISLDSPIDSVVKHSTAKQSTTPYGKSRTDSTASIVAARPQSGRAPASRSSDTFNRYSTRLRSLITNGFSKPSGTQSAPASADSKDWPQGQRELLLPKAVQKTISDERRNSVAKRPPVSYKPPANSHSSGGSASVPPIRSFRSSGSRRSLTLDMNGQSPRAYTIGDSYGDSNHRDRTLRALEGRQDYAQQITPPDSARTQADLDDSGDVFLKIAREEMSRRGADEDGGYADNQSAISRIIRNSRRPLSFAVSPYQPSSPPQMLRRLSDQDNSRTRGSSEDQPGERIARSLTYRGASKERASEETRLKGSSQLRASPLAPPRSFVQDNTPEQSQSSPVVNYSRRRQQSIDTGSAVPSRMSSLKTSSFAYGNGRSFNSSPLALKSADIEKPDFHPGDGAHGREGREGTESTTSTAAPSTVWDELDDLKSRIHRLELTGKLPPTSGAAISRASQERPPTANTNATTMSASPKRGSGSASQVGDVTITPGSLPSSQKDSHPILHSALAKSKQFLTAEVYSALETAATDALNLSSIMGTAGQPGPISSAASSVGTGPVVTDRQLRRKADSICRSLTELCLALSEGAAQINPQRVAVPAPENSPPGSPTITKFTGFTSQRLPSSSTDRNISVPNSPRAIPSHRQATLATERNPSVLGSPRTAPIHRQTHSATDRGLSVLSSPRAAPSHRPSNSAIDRSFSVVSSPKTVSRLEERRSSMLLSGALPSPRLNSMSSSAALANVIATPTEHLTAGRKSTMLLSRNRRAQTEEPEDTRKTVLRTRRAGTEEPEESIERRSSVLVRSRRGTIDRNDEEEPRFRAPPRVVTEVHGSQSRTREYTSQTPLTPLTPRPTSNEASPLASSALPRRRLGSSAVNTRLVPPSASTGFIGRRYMERSTPDRESFNLAADNISEERDQRRLSVHQNASSSRAGSLKRSNRQSMIAISSAAQSNYR